MARWPPRELPASLRSQGLLIRTANLHNLGLANRKLAHQSGAGQDTPAGLRYLQSATNGWRFQLFVRVRKNEPYWACGLVSLEEASGNRPMSITWKLQSPLPARLFREFSVLRDG